MNIRYPIYEGVYRILTEEGLNLIFTVAINSLILNYTECKIIKRW